MDKKYILLKDMPHVKSGTIYVKTPVEIAKDKCTYHPDLPGCKNSRFFLHKDFVEDETKWFKEFTNDSIKESIRDSIELSKTLHQISTTFKELDFKYTQELTEIQQSALDFHNFMNEDEQLSKEMFLVAWGNYLNRCKKIVDGKCDGRKSPKCYNECRFYFKNRS